MRRCPASKPLISDPKGEGNPPLLLPAGTGSETCWRTGATYSTQEHRAGRLLADRSNLNPPRSPQLMIIDEKNHCKICPNTVFSQKIENPLIFNQFFFFGRNSGISHLCATLDLRLHSGYPAGYPAGCLAGCPDVRPDISWTSSRISGWILSMDNIHG